MFRFRKVSVKCVLGLLIAILSVPTVGQNSGSGTPASDPAQVVKDAKEAQQAAEKAAADAKAVLQQAQEAQQKAEEARSEAKN